MWYRTLNKNRDKRGILMRPGMAQGEWVLSFRVLLLVFGLFSFLSVDYADCLCLANESRALLAWKSENQLEALSSWKEGSDCCRGWAGVSCDNSATHVVALKLTVRSQASNLHIPKTVCDFYKLRVFSISIGSFYGDGGIPFCLWNMTKMRYLSISTPLEIFTELDYYTFWRQGRISVQGSLPAQVCNLRHLTHLDIGGVFFESATIPDCFWTMTQLKHLTFGPIAMFSQVCNLSGLTHLDVISDYNMDVQIPSCIWKMTKLKFLSLISFQKPSVINVCNMKSLTHLDLTGSSLDGGILSCIWNLTNLEHLGWQSFYLSPTVSLSSDICNLKNLSYLAMNFVAAAQSYVPACIWNMTRLEVLELLPSDESPQLPGSFSAQLCSLSKVRRLALPYLGITGVLPACIWRMPHLEYLDLSGLDLSIMEYPIDVFAPSLTELYLHATNIGAAFLDAVGKLTSLNQLEIGRNSIASLPDGMQNLSLLESLYASSNMIRKVQSVSNLSELTNLDLADNPLQDISELYHLPTGLFYLQLQNCSLGNSGLAPSCLRRLLQLGSLGISGNNISGDLSDLIFGSVYNLTNFVALGLSNNNISGDLSSFSEPLPNLEWLDVSSNQLTGELPRSLLSMSFELYYLNVSGNRLRGRLPGPDGPYAYLTLDASGNKFEGALPSFLMSTFQELVLSKNMFTGVIPVELRRSSQSLYILDLSHNNLSGEIPAYFGNFSQLAILDLTSNNFNGSIPEALGDCISLQHLRLKDNSLRGRIPSTIGTIGSSLQSLTISYNGIEGSIPATLGNCVGLTLLDLSHNNLNGTLPSTLENLSASLRVFTVGSNRLSGPFPAWIISDNFTSLQVLDLSNNSFYGELTADYSKLSGFVNGTNSNNNETLYDESLEISAKGNILQLAYIVTVRTSFDVSSNQFSGNIPEQLGDLRALRYLTLSSNAFSGNIPTQLSNLRELESLDLSRNSLSGSIPLQMAAIATLEYFNVSCNFLTGAIPEGGQFNTFNESSFRNNSALCSFPLQPCRQNPPRASDDDSGKSWISVDGLLLGFGTGFGVVGLTFVFSTRARSRLYCPRRKVRRVYSSTVPYGTYVPKS